MRYIDLFFVRECSFTEEVAVMEP